MLFLNIKLNDLLDGKSTYCWFIFDTNRSQSPFLIDVNQVNWIPILHPMNKYLSHNVSLPYKYKCYIFSRRSFIHVHNYSYNMCNICICSTEKLKFIPLLCTHINSYVLWKVHPPRMLQGSGKVSKRKQIGATSWMVQMVISKAIIFGSSMIVIMRFWKHCKAIQSNNNTKPNSINHITFNSQPK